MGNEIEELQRSLHTTTHDMLRDLGYTVALRAGIMGRLQHLRQQRTNSNDVKRSQPALCRLKWRATIP